MSACLPVAAARFFVFRVLLIKIRSATETLRSVKTSGWPDSPPITPFPNVNFFVGAKLLKSLSTSALVAVAVIKISFCDYEMESKVEFQNLIKRLSPKKMYQQFY